MGTLKDYIKESSILNGFKEIRNAIMALLEENFADLTVAEAIAVTGKENPAIIPELEKIDEIYNTNEKVLDEMAGNRFEYNFGIVPKKDSDGYNALENKLSDIKAKVSEQEAIKDTGAVNREKGGKQKTRVDED